MLSEAGVFPASGFQDSDADTNRTDQSITYFEFGNTRCNRHGWYGTKDAQPYIDIQLERDA